MDTADPINLYWWSRHKNFGDLIGPWMVETITGRPTRNIKGRNAPKSVTGLATAGSLMTALDRPGLEIWGTGAMRPISRRRAEMLKDREPARIHAVRGPLTRRTLRRRLGWSVPAVYGDPAMLVPRLYMPRPRPDVAGKTAIVAHYIHKQTLGALDRERFHWIEVQDDPDTVVDQIAAARRVISSSLHGVIIAQAYGVPWVRLKVAGEPLGGGDFKFQDFYLGLEGEAVREAEVEPGLVTDAGMTAIGDTAHAPRWTIDGDRLWDAFPLHSRA